MEEGQDQIVPVAAGEVIDGSGINFDWLPHETQKKIVANLDLDAKKNFRLVNKYARELVDKNFVFHFNWDRHLREKPAENTASSAANFRFTLSPVWKLWKQDLIGALVDFNYFHPDLNETVYWIAKIVKVEVMTTDDVKSNRYYVLLRYLSPEEERGDDQNCIDLWINLLKTDSANFLGWNLEHGITLVPPLKILESLIQVYGFEEDEDGFPIPAQPLWRKYFFPRRLIDAPTLPNRLSKVVQQALESDAGQRVKVGDLVEIFDTKKHDLLHVGVVRITHGSRVLIQYKGAGARKVEDVWCHHLSQRFELCGWAKTVGLEIVVPPGLNIPYNPPTLPASQMEGYRVAEFYTNLEVGMTLEIINPYKPSSIVAGKIAKVLKWGSFIVQINSDRVPSYGSTLVCRNLNSLDVFHSGFAVEHGIPLENPFDNQRDVQLTPLPKVLLQKLLLLNAFKIDELLEAFDWWDFHLRPAKIVQTAGRLVKIRYVGFPPKKDQWLDISSGDIYPMGWSSLLEFPLEFPLYYGFRYSKFE